MKLFFFKLWAKYKSFKYSQSRKRWLKQVEPIIIDPKALKQDIKEYENFILKELGNE